MNLEGERVFSDAMVDELPLWDYYLDEQWPRSGFEEVNQALEFVQIEKGLLAAYSPDYPLVEPRELIPPFDAPLIEYPELPAFSLVVLDRSLSYQDENFQFDMLVPEGRPPDAGLTAQNRSLLRDRLPRNLLPEADRVLGRRPLTPLARYAEILPFLVQMDRAHVIARDDDGYFRLAGVFASLPSDLDGEIKRLGNRIGKFQRGDNRLYGENRLFVYRFLMEELGFPICGERHTSAGLFARRLMRRRERFSVRVLGHSDRAITTLTSLGAENTRIPRVEKVALVSVAGHGDQEGMDLLRDQGYFLDPERGVVILRVSYRHHEYRRDNVLEARALSVVSQEVIHPRDGRVAAGMDVLGLGQDRLLLLNDIIRGEYRGSIVYRGKERVVGTADPERRLRFLTAWLRKNQMIMADYSPDHFQRVLKLLDTYLEGEDGKADLERWPGLHQEVQQALADLKVSHRLRLLEKLVRNRADSFGRRLQHVQILIILVHVLSQEGERLAESHPKSLRKLLRMIRRYLDNPYLRRHYMARQPETAYERQVVGHAKLLYKLLERFEARAGIIP